MFSKFVLLQNYGVQVSGATDKIYYYVSGNPCDQDGAAIGPYFERYNTYANVETQAKKWLRLGINIVVAHKKMQQTDQGAYSIVTPIPAVCFILPYWDPYKEDDSLALVNDDSRKDLSQSPLEWIMNNSYSSKKNEFIGSIFFEVTPIEGLKIRSQTGLNHTGIGGETFSTPSYRPSQNQGRAARSNSHAYNLSITDTAEYRFNLNHIHNFNFLIGQEGVDYQSEGFSVVTTRQSNDRLAGIATGTRATSWGNNDMTYSYISFFGCGEYNYDSRYYTDPSLRIDGPPRFGVKGRWATFWSMGLVWNLFNEKFMKDYEWLTTAQLAISTRTSGNFEIPSHDYLALVGGGSNYLGDAGLAPLTKGNEGLEWERLQTTNVAIHLGFFNHINLGAELYNKKTTNIFMAVPVAYVDAGYDSHWDNVGGVINHGVGLNLNADTTRTKNFAQNISTNVSYNKNEVTELCNGVQEYVVATTDMKPTAGHSYSEFYLNCYTGINPAAGDPLWYNKNGEVIPVMNESDKALAGRSYITPWQGGSDTVVSWKGLLSGAQFSQVTDRWMISNDCYFEENTTSNN